jgi:hypothetical protein
MQVILNEKEILTALEEYISNTQGIPLTSRLVSIKLKAGRKKKDKDGNTKESGGYTAYVDIEDKQPVEPTVEEGETPVEEEQAIDFDFKVED